MLKSACKVEMRCSCPKHDENTYKNEENGPKHDENTRTEGDMRRDTFTNTKVTVGDLALRRVERRYVHVCVCMYM